VGSPEVILLDTQVALWLLAGSSSMGKRCRRIAEEAAAAAQLAISAISFWEIALLVGKRRLRWTDSATEIRRQILIAGVNELPLNGVIAILAGELEGLHSDPADRFIAASAIVHDATLLTADERLLSWRYPLRRHNAEV
jgi:PIN domain nuclease of toxin-antitoxin system